MARKRFTSLGISAASKDRPLEALAAEINNSWAVAKILEKEFEIDVSQVREALRLAAFEFQRDYKQSTRLVLAVRAEIFRTIGSKGILRKKSEVIRARYRHKGIPLGNPIATTKRGRLRVNRVEHLRLADDDYSLIREYLMALGQVNPETEMSHVRELLEFEPPKASRFVDGNLRSFGITTQDNLLKLPPSDIAMLTAISKWRL